MMKGILLGDRYRILQALGAGGMGRTYLAEDTHRPGRAKCVVKWLRPASTDVYFLATARRLFNAEAEVLEQLGKHDRIPALLAYFEQGEEFYLVQQLIEGHPLGAELPTGQRWTEPQVIRLLQEVLEILEIVHSYNVIHRDLKPDNLIRRSDGKLVLIDFGAVKQVRMQPTALGYHPTVVVGTPGYMPPEQATGRPRPSSDLYALGMIAIQALTGVLPTQLIKDANGEINWRNLAQVSPGLGFFISKLARRQVGDRFQSATEALQALQPIRSEIGEAEYVSPALPALAPAMRPPVDRGSPSLGVANLSEAVPQGSRKKAVSVAPPVSQSAAQPAARFSPAQLRSIRAGKWLLVGGTMTGVMAGSFAVLAANWQAEQMQQDTLANVIALRDQDLVAECIAAAQAVPPEYSIYGDVRAVMYQCQAAQYQQNLIAAKQFAEAGQFQSALSQAGTIPATSSAYGEAQQLMQQWSDRIQTIAAEYYQTGNIDGALAALGEIPATSPAYPQAQNTMVQWQQEWQENQALLYLANQAIETAEWEKAIGAVRQMTFFGNVIAPETLYWQQQLQPIVSLAEAELAKAAAQQATATEPVQQPQAQPQAQLQTQPQTQPPQSLPWQGGRRSPEVRGHQESRLH